MLAQSHLVEGRQAVTVYHGTIARRVESIGRDGLRPTDDGAAFVSGDEEIANEYALARVAYDMVHHGGPNRMLLVIARVPAERLTRLPREPTEGELPCLAKEDGYKVAGGVRPQEIVEMFTATCRGLEDPDGLVEVYRNHFYWKEMATALSTGSRKFDQGLYDELGHPV